MKLGFKAMLMAGLLLAGAGMLQAQKQEDDSDFEKRTFGEGKEVLPYRLIKPVGKHEGKRPLIVFLHGMGERGSDNTAQLKYLREFLRSAAKEGCYAIAPQCPNTTVWAFFQKNQQGEVPANQPVPQKQVLEVVAALQKEFSIDESRLYLTGLSMGGFGSWDILARHPGLFAAAAPICGGGDPAKAAAMKGTPIWAFHGDQDKAVPVQRSRDMVAAIKKIDGNVKYTEYPGVGHDSWIKAYGDPELLKWMLAQKKK